MAENLEVERKYELPEGFTMPSMIGIADVVTVTAPEEHQLDAIYYDTTGLRLTRGRVTLRRRTGGHDAGWHLKRPSGGERSELQVPATAAEQHAPEAITTPVRALTRAEPLQPIAQIRTRRLEHALRTADGRTVALVADDTVETTSLIGARVVQQWRELEVELVDGSLTDLQHIDATLRRAGAHPSASPSKLSRALGPDHPGTGPAKTSTAEARPAKTGSAETGFAETGAAETGLTETGAAAPGTGKTGSAKTGGAEPGAAETGLTETGAAAPSAGKTGGAKTGGAKTGLAETGAAEPGGGKTGSAGRRALTGYLRAQLDAIVEHDPAVRGGDAEAVHRMRVATRRLRSTLRTYASVLPEHNLDHLHEEAKWLTGVLGAVRDGDVMAERLGALLDAEPPELIAGPVAARVTQHLTAERATARTRLVEALDSTRYIALLTDLDALLEATAAGGRLPRTQLRRLARKALRRADRLLDTAEGDAALHEARKAYKRARYAIELCTPIAGAPAQRLADRLTDLQDVLGTHQDAIVTCDVLRTHGMNAFDAGENAFSYGLLHARQHELGRRALKHLPRARRRTTKRTVRHWLD